jgi:hypothetical protein
MDECLYQNKGKRLVGGNMYRLDSMKVIHLEFSYAVSLQCRVVQLGLHSHLEH